MFGHLKKENEMKKEFKVVQDGENCWLVVWGDVGVWSMKTEREAGAIERFLNNIEVKDLERIIEWKK